MKKIVKKYGNSHVIILSPEDLQVYNLKEGDVVDISDIIVTDKALCREDKNNKSGTALMPPVNKSEQSKAGDKVPFHNNFSGGGLE